MNSIDILNAIGDVDDEYAAKAKAKRTSYKKVWITLGSSLAACLALFVAVPVIFAMTMKASAPAPGAAQPPEATTPHGETAPPEDGVVFETALVHGDVDIYYVDGYKTARITKDLHYSPKEIFAAWREANGIGDEVEFIKCEIKDNSTTVEKETSYGSVMEHTVGDYFILNVTISKNIENYYDRIDSKTLLDTLRLTMTGYSDIEFDEYHLILV